MSEASGGEQGGQGQGKEVRGGLRSSRGSGARQGGERQGKGRQGELREAVGQGQGKKRQTVHMHASIRRTRSFTMIMAYSITHSYTQAVRIIHFPTQWWG